MSIEKLPSSNPKEGEVESAGIETKEGFVSAFAGVLLAYIEENNADFIRGNEDENENEDGVKGLIFFPLSMVDRPLRIRLDDEHFGLIADLMAKNNLRIERMKNPSNDEEEVIKITLIKSGLTDTTA